MSSTAEQQLAATVLVAYGSHGVVRVDDGPPLHCLFRRRVGRPCCGDRIMIAPADDASWVAEALLPRDNQFMRADQRGRQQVVAANLDRVVVVLATAPLPSRDLLDRYLVAAHSLSIEPLIVMNKVELPFDEKDAGAQTFARLDYYESMGYAVLRTSCKGAPGVGELAPGVQDITSIFVGQSGVGKSSLIRLLIPDLDIQTGALSTVTGKGTHTTTTTILHDLPDGGHLIDSPGVWEYGLWKLDDQALAHGYRDFGPWLGQCRFNDCLHRSEPGCAVQDAVAREELPGWRHASYLRLLEQNQAATAPGAGR
jgi:ribosome biogenesis GTPase